MSAELNAAAVLHLSTSLSGLRVEGGEGAVVTTVVKLHRGGGPRTGEHQAVVGTGRCSKIQYR